MLDETLKNSIDEHAGKIQPTVINHRKELHKIPELSFELPKTRAYILNILAAYEDLKVEEDVNTGIVATLFGAPGGKTVAYRTDMDALPLTEETGLDFASTHEGKMHACGHDGHMAIALGILDTLYTFRDGIKGNVKFIFQPAEETTGGAKGMVAQGCLKNPDVDYVFGTHIWPTIESGKLALVDGPIMAATDIITIDIQGKGGHGGLPNKAVNPIVVASKIVAEVEAIKNYFVSPTENSVISICSIHGGTAQNIIPDKIKIEGTVRTFSTETQELIKNKIDHIINQVCGIYGASYDYTYHKNLPATINDGNVVKEVKKVLEENGLSDSILEVKEPSTGAEDFSEYLMKVPGMFFWLGTKNESKGIIQGIHNPKYNMDHDIFEKAVATMTKIILEFTEK